MPLVVATVSLLTPWAVMVAIVMFAVIGGALGALYLKRAHVLITAAEIGKTGLLRRHMRARAEIAAVVTAPIQQTRLSSRTLRHLFVLDDAGRPIVHIDEGFWTQGDIDRIVEHLGITPIRPGRTVTFKEVSERYPKALSWRARHPLLAAMALVAAAYPAIFVIAVIVGAVPGI
jgi:hypothetical protein